METESLRPIRKFSSFFQDNTQYQCYQKCLPVVDSQPENMIELCNKICPFQPDIPECKNCIKILSQMSAKSNIDDFNRRQEFSQAESIIIEPDSHVIFFKPEIVVAGEERKQCCYLDQCETVPINSKCESRCYEPCDAVCTGRCQVNPQCPNQCVVVKQQLFKVKYKIWLAQKLNEIKRKYRAAATACLLKTRMEFVGEVQKLHQNGAAVLGGPVSFQVDELQYDEQQDDEQQDDYNNNSNDY